MAPKVKAEDQIIKVGLIVNTKQVTIGAKEGIELLLSNGDNLKLNSKRNYNFFKSKEYIMIDKKKIKAKRIIIIPIKDNSLITVNDNRYQGYIELLSTAKGLTIINHVKLNNYLASVVGSEINSNWPMEVLKAQAVVARTYALRNLNSHLSKGYNLSSTVTSQAYKGVRFQTLSTTKAVKETTGEVITYQGRLISAVYHSSSGGKTAKGSTIWKSNTPYLQSVTSTDNLSPHYQWQREYSKRELEMLLVKSNINIFELEKIYLKNLGPSSRPEQVVIVGTNNKYTIDSSKFRFLLNLRSTKFTIETKKRNTDKLNSKQLVYVFKGSGWGHGVGMSQWGAYQMALKGSKYQEILNHYYKNIKIIKR